MAASDTSPEAPESLSDDQRNVLALMARALQRYGLYPPDHPAVEPVAGQLHERLVELVERGGPLSIGVGPKRLYVDDGASPPDDHQLRALADHLHHHQIGRLTFAPGLDASDLHEFLTAVCEPAKEGTEPLARRDEPTSWQGVSVEPVWYEQLEMAGEAEGDEPGAAGSPGARLWMDLARATGALPGEEDAEGEPVSVERVIAAIDAGPAGREFDRKVLGQLLRILRELEGAEGTAGRGLRERVSLLIETLDREQLIRMMDRADPDELRQLLTSAARRLRTGSVVELVDAASGSGRLDLSRWMLLLLGKLSRHASENPGLSGAEAENAFREDVRAITGRLGEREDAESDYPSALERMSRWTDGRGSGAGDVPEVPAERTLTMSLEIGRMGQMGEAALEELLEAGETTTALELVAAAPEGSEAAARLWDLLVEAGSLGTVLTREDADLDVVERLVERMGSAAAPALLDAMAEAEDRSLRGRLFALVSDLGPGVADHAVRRLDDERWFVVRNMLSLLGQVASPRDVDFDPRRFVDHPHPAVREEAYRLLFRSGAEPELVAKGLRDPAPRVLRAALAAAGPDPREPVLGRLLGHLDDPVDEKTERAAVRAVSRSDDPRVRERLVERCREDRFLWRLFRGPLAPPGPVAAEALAVLAAGPFDDSTVQKLVEAARESDDERYRRAAEGRRP